MTSEKIEKYTKQLFILVESKANVSEFVLLYAEVFDEKPSEQLIANYMNRINNDDDDSYESYEESYSYDDSYNDTDDE